MDYVKMAALAKKLIEKNGRTATFRNLAPSSDPTKPWRSSSPAVLSSVTQKAAFVSLSSRHLGIELTQEQLNSRANELVMAGISTLDLSTVNQIVDGTATFNIEWMQMVKPGDQVLFYAFGIKR
jgi:hypothetical protein